MRYLPLIVKNTLRNRRRTLLTVGSVGLSLCLLGVLMALYYALYHGEAAPEQALRLTTRNRISLTVSMPSYYMQQIARVEGVREVMEWQWYGGTYKDARDFKNFFPRFGIDPRKMFGIFAEFSIPEPEKLAFQRNRRACIVGRRLADRLGFKTGDRITLTGDIYPGSLELTVAGIYDSAENNESLFFHWEYVREGLPASRKDMLGTFSILADSPENVPRIARQIDEMFRNATAQTRTESERTFQLGFFNMIGNVKLILLTICAAVTFTILLVTGNTMAMNVRERVREVGILKTLGYRNGVILGLVLGEAAAIALIGGFFGHLMASGLCFLMRTFTPGMGGPLRSLAVTPPVALVLFAAAIAIALVSSYIPARSAAQTTILDAMRYTG